MGQRFNTIHLRFSNDWPLGLDDFVSLALHLVQVWTFEWEVGLTSRWFCFRCSNFMASLWFCMVLLSFRFNIGYFFMWILNVETCVMAGDEATPILSCFVQPLPSFRSFMELQHHNHRDKNDIWQQIHVLTWWFLSGQADPCIWQQALFCILLSYNGSRARNKPLQQIESMDGNRNVSCEKGGLCPVPGGILPQYGPFLTRNNKRWFVRRRDPQAGQDYCI